jgi:uncharacterized protein YecE (DUF72 family)
VLVGTYGFAYKEWVGPFYPKGVPTEERLGYYAGVFGAVEMVHTYYGAPKAEAVARWREQTPEEFRISIKVPRWVAARVQGAAKRGETEDAGLSEDVGRLVEVLRPLGSRLGPLVLQFDAGFNCPAGLSALRGFLGQWPNEAAQLAVEFRHPSWFEDREAEALLAQHDVAWVWNDLEPQAANGKRVPRAIDDPVVLRDTSSKVIYVRLSGSHAGKQTHYTPKVDRGDELRRWAELVKRQLRAKPGRTAYVMLSDHYAGIGPDTARELQELLRS